MLNRTLGVLKRLGIIAAIGAYYALWVRISAWYGATSGLRDTPRQELAWYQMPEMNATLWGFSFMTALIGGLAFLLAGGLLVAGIISIVRWIFVPSPEDIERDQRRKAAKEKALQLAREAKATAAAEATEAAKRANLDTNGEPKELHPTDVAAPENGGFEQPPGLEKSVA